MSGSVDSKDVQQLQAAMKVMPRQLIEAGSDALVETTKDIARQAASRARSRPGGGSYKREPGAYSAKGGDEPAVVIAGGGTAIAAEYGTNFHTVFGRRMAASEMVRRVFPVRTGGDQLSGYIVGRLVTESLRHTERDVAKAMDKAAEQTFTRAGI